MSQGQGIFLAKALFDNIAETPDELAFRRGDVLTVLEQDTKGLEGWWLCTLRGKHGIAPGNRLKILSGMGEGAGGSFSGDSGNKDGMEFYDQLKGGDSQDYDVPPSNRGSIDVGPPSRRASHDSVRYYPGSRKASLGDDLYDTPPSSKRGSTENSNGIYDTPPSSKRASSERTPPHSNRSSASRDSGSNLLSSNSPSQLSLGQQHSSSTLSLPTTLRRRSGSHSSENCYETPPGSNRSSLERILSEEGPPIYESLSPATSTEQLHADDPTYDTPPSRSHTLSLANANHASQSSLRSVGSSESLLSNTSGVSSARLSQATSLPDSARSSMDLPSDLYDVPPSAQEADKSRKQLSMDSGLGFYDSPVKSRPSSSTSNTLTSSSDGIRSSQSSFDCKPSYTKDIKRSRSLEHAVDDLYDTPRNNAPKISLKKLEAGYGSSSGLNDPSGVYDIPPQVTRDSVISSRSDSSEENQRLSSSSLESEQHLYDFPVWDELLLDLDSALELLVKRQQDVSKATSKIASYVNNTWRTRASLEKTLYDIKVSCTLVRNSLLEFVDFAHGAIANAVRIPDRQLASRLQKYVAPLQNTLEFVNRSFMNLEEMKWQVSLLAEPFDNKPDDLGQIALVAKDLLPEVKKVASFIQSNGTALFKRAVVEDKKLPVSSKPPIGPKAIDSNGGKGPGYSQGKAKNMQHRPLPAVPGSEKRSAPLSTAVMAAPALADKSKFSIYDIKASFHKDDYEECSELPPEKDPEQARKEVMELCVQEYDYVQLDTSDAHIRYQGKTIVPVISQNDYTDKGDKVSKNLQSKPTSGDCRNKEGRGDMDMIPVKEKMSDSSSDGSDNSNGDKSVANVKDDRRNRINSLEDTSGSDFPEEDLKTPVNKDSSTEGSNFILPSPEPMPPQTNEPLDPNDRQVLAYYIEQMNTHSTLLNNAIDAFIGVVSNNQPPNVFISHSKFVIVSAHKLVHIGDSIHRNLISNNVSLRIMHCANHLCDCLKASVTATKTAALQYPSVPAVQEMVDKVIAVSHAAHELKLVITQAAK